MDERAQLIKELQADLVWAGRRNELLKMANVALLEENKALKQQLQICKDALRAENANEKPCEVCGGSFWGGKTARFCPACRKARHREAAKTIELNKLGTEAWNRRANNA